MKPIDFPEKNLDLGKDQPEYTTLPVFVDWREAKTPEGETKTVAWSMVSCHELSDEEIEELTKTRRLYHRQLLFGNNFQPIFMSTKDPFNPDNKQHWPQD